MPKYNVADLLRVHGVGLSYYSRTINYSWLFNIFCNHNSSCKLNHFRYNLLPSYSHIFCLSLCLALSPSPNFSRTTSLSRSSYLSLSLSLFLSVFFLSRSLSPKQLRFVSFSFHHVSPVPLCPSPVSSKSSVFPSFFFSAS